MFQIALRGVRHNVGRYIATLVAIMTGVAFFTATGFLSDRVIAALDGDVNRQFSSVDVAVVVDTSNADAYAEQLVLPGKDLDAIAEVDGVEAVAGQVSGPVAFVGKNGKAFGRGTTGRQWTVDDQLNPVDISKGRAPKAKGEIAVDGGTAEREGLKVGDRVKLASVGGVFDEQIVGLTDFGSSDAVDSGGTVSLPEAQVFEALTGGRAEYQEAYLRGSGDPAKLAKAVRAIAPKGFEVQTGDEFRADKRAEIGGFGRVLKQGLQGFATLALLVGGFVIYNTFSVIIAQRQRELAVLSAIGATPKQIKRSLRYEGILVGLLGSTLGVAVGVGLTFLLIAVLNPFGVALPGSGIKIAPNTVIGGLMSGTIITIASVMIPARRAAKTEPIEALRDASTESAAVTKSRTIASVALLGLGALGLFFGSQPAAIGFGAFLLVVGVLVAGPLIAIGGATIARPFLDRLGLEGQLAADNSIRSPKRTATTANALLIGVFLVTLVTVAGTSLKDFAVREIQKLESADFIVSSSGGSIDQKLVKDIKAIDGVESVTPFRRESVTVDGKPSQLATADAGALVKVASIKATKGSIDDLGPGKIAVANGPDDDFKLGDTVKVASTSGTAKDLKVVAVLEANLDQSQVGNLVDVPTFDALVGDTAPRVALVDAKNGTETDTQKAIEDLTETRPDIAVTPGNAIGKLIGSIFDFLIKAINGLLLMSVVVALIGIVNTLSLSILERRRELGLLRIIGMTDKRVQRMVRLESVLISALGTVTGVLLGLTLGWGLIFAINRTANAGIGYSFPGTQLLLVLVLGAVLGFLASIIPSRRSTRLDVLDAVQAS